MYQPWALTRQGNPAHGARSADLRRPSSCSWLLLLLLLLWLVLVLVLVLLQMGGQGSGGKIGKRGPYKKTAEKRKAKAMHN